MGFPLTVADLRQWFQCKSFIWEDIPESSSRGVRKWYRKQGFVMKQDTTTCNWDSVLPGALEDSVEHALDLFFLRETSKLAFLSFSSLRHCLKAASGMSSPSHWFGEDAPRWRVTGACTRGVGSAPQCLEMPLPWKCHSDSSRSACPNLFFLHTLRDVLQFTPWFRQKPLTPHPIPHFLSGTKSH